MPGSLPRSASEPDYEEWAAKQFAYAFQRSEVRKCRKDIFRADCGHEVDVTEPYRYQVWRTNDEPRGHINQRTDCEFCARRDLNG